MYVLLVYVASDKRVKNDQLWTGKGLASTLSLFIQGMLIVLGPHLGQRL